MNESIISWQSFAHGLHKADAGWVQECADYYADTDTEVLASIVCDTTEDASYRNEPRFGLLIVLAESGRYGSGQGFWREHKACKGFAGDENSDGSWNCYTHNMFHQVN